MTSRWLLGKRAILVAAKAVLLLLEARFTLLKIKKVEFLS